MQADEHLTMPLRRLLWRGVVRILTFESSSDRWSHRSAAERAERRAQWPAWRRAVRPVGLAAYWSGVVCYVVFGDDPGSATVAAVVRFGLTLLLLPIAWIGVRDWFRDVPSKRQAAATSTPSAAGHSDPASRHGVAPERPVR